MSARKEEPVCARAHTCTKALTRMPTHTHTPDPVLRIDWFSNYDYSNQQTLWTSFQMEKKIPSRWSSVSISDQCLHSISSEQSAAQQISTSSAGSDSWVTSYVHDAVCAQQCCMGQQGPLLWLLWKMGISNLEASVISNFIRRCETIWRNTRTGWTALLWGLLQV